MPLRHGSAMLSIMLATSAAGICFRIEFYHEDRTEEGRVFNTHALLGLVR